MKLKLFLSTCFLTTFLFSCTDNSNDLDPNCSLENAMMLKVGNYWIYSTTELDENGNAVTGTEGIDSSYVSGMQTVAGKQAFLMITHSKLLKEDSLKIDTTSYAVEGSRAYMILEKSVRNLIGNCDCFNSEWFVFADCNRTQWVAADKKIKGADYPTPNSNGSIDTSFIETYVKVNGKNGGFKNIKVDTSSLTATIFEYKQSVLLKLFSTEPKAVFDATGTKEISVEKDTKNWLMEGIGIIQSETNGFKIGYYPFNNGFRKTLIRYSVK